MKKLIDLPNGVFLKSSISNTRPMPPPWCVEVAKDSNGVKVRDSKDQSGNVLFFSKEEWNAFLAGAKNGEFDI